jgi:radical SAM superfamily enzyme YgiQ (UPF0313 family)
MENKSSVLLVAINSKATQFNLAVEYLNKALKASDPLREIRILSLTINQHLDDMLKELFLSKADVLCFSCYIWNIEFILKLIPEIKKLCPKSQIILGGPEVSYNPQEYLDKNLADFVICGAGEESLPLLVEQIDKTALKKDLKQIPGLVCKDVNNIRVQTQNFDLVPNVFKDLNVSKHLAFVHYESSRGCPFRCDFCLSSLDDKVCYASIEKIKMDFKNIFENNSIQQIRFVDRTFNSNAKRAREIWKFLMEEYPDKQFHFEVAIELLNEEDFELLSEVKPDRFQFEIGIQSIHDHILRQNGRKCDLKSIESKLAGLHKTSVVIHLDLLVGLLGQTKDDFKESFEWVFAQKADHFQIETIKFLKGSLADKKRSENGAEVTDHAPYNLLYNNHWSYEDILETENVAEVLELLYNRECIKEVFLLLAESKQKTYEYCLSFANYLKQYQNEPLSLKNLYAHLHKWIESNETAPQGYLDLLTLDYLNHFQSGGIVPWKKNSKTLDRAQFMRMKNENNWSAKGFVEVFSNSLTYRGQEGTHWYFNGKKEPYVKCVFLKEKNI